MEVTEGISYTTLGELINKHREQAGLTQSELARNAGLSKTAISMIERGEIKLPEFMTIKKIADVLGIEKAELIEHYVEFEKRPDILQEMLLEAAELSNLQLVTKIAEKFLESPRQDTETALKRLNDLSSTIADTTIKLSLYKTIVTYSRQRGVQRYLAKGLLQTFLIEMLNLKRLEESFRLGEEVLHYTDFLNQEERITLYYQMAFQAHDMKKYEQCIKLGKLGHEEDTTENELKERVALAICNSYSRLNNLIGLEEHLERYEKLGYVFIIERLKYFRAIILSKSQKYHEAIPLLRECMEEATSNNRLNRINDLLEVLFKINDVDSVEEILEQEEKNLLIQTFTPYKYSELGKYYKHKGEFLVTQGLFDDGIEAYLQAMHFFSKINAWTDISKCSESIFVHHYIQGKEMKLEALKKLGKVYNIVNNVNVKEVVIDEEISNIDHGFFADPIKLSFHRSKLYHSR